MTAVRQGTESLAYTIELMRKVAEIPAVTTYLSAACQSMKALYTRAYTHPIPIMKQRLCSTDISWQGVVEPDALEDAIEHGNIRERVILLMHFSCDTELIMHILHNEYHLQSLVNKSRCDELLKRLKKMTCIQDTKRLWQFYSNHRNDAYWLYVLSNPYEGSVSLAHYDEYMNHYPARIKRVNQHANASTGIRVSEAVPPLSKREIALICKMTQKYTLNANEVLPWELGNITWQLPSQGLFYSLAKVGSNLMIAGPSGGTDAFIRGMSLLKNFNIELCVLAYAVYSCGGHNHSLFEVFIAAEAHGLPFNSTMHAVDYLNHLTRKYGMHDITKLIHIRQPQQQTPQLAIALDNIPFRGREPKVDIINKEMVRIDGLQYHIAPPPRGRTVLKMKIMHSRNPSMLDLVYYLA